MNYMKEALARVGYDEDPVYKDSVLLCDLGIYNTYFYQYFGGYDGMNIDEVIGCIPFEDEHDFTDFVEDYTTEIWKNMKEEALTKNGYADYDTINKTVNVIRDSMYNDMSEISDRVWEELYMMKHELETKEGVVHD